jgi:hypothetical protein
VQLQMKWQRKVAVGLMFTVGTLWVILAFFYCMLDQLTINSVTIVSILRLRYLVAFGKSSNPLCKSFHSASVYYCLIPLQGTVLIPSIGPTSRSTLRFGVSVCPTFVWSYENSSPNWRAPSARATLPRGPILRHDSKEGLATTHRFTHMRVCISPSQSKDAEKMSLPQVRRIW